MSHCDESWAELAEFWANGGDVPKDFKPVEHYDHQITGDKSGGHGVSPMEVKT